MDDIEARVAEIVDPLRRPTVLLRKSGADFTSYLGGRPPAFQGFAWPRRDGRPLGFLGCIDLGRFSAITWLPKSGLLLFFYDVDKQPWGFDPRDRGGWAVAYVPDSSPVGGLAPYPNDLEAEWRIPRRDVSFRVASVPPPWDLSTLGSVDRSDEDDERIFHALDALREKEYGKGPKHQIGGYPEPVQGAEMEMECQLASNGIYVGDLQGDADPRVEAVRAGASEWRLLFQMDSDDDLKIMWGDCGMIYFWVREQDARRGDFSGAWLVLQCH